MTWGYKKVEVDFSVFQYFNVRIFCSVNLISAVYLQNLLNESFASFKTSLKFILKESQNQCISIKDSIM